MSKEDPTRRDHIFRGWIEHFSTIKGGLAVDWFENLFDLHFLSHAHTDHYCFKHEKSWIGLLQPEFMEKLQNKPRARIFCTQITRDIIQRYLVKGGRQDVMDELKLLDKHFVILEPNGTIDIDLVNRNGEKSGEKITVTTIPANHIPGAVMFLFEDGEKRALYTGDFRYDVREDNEEMKQLKEFVENYDKVIDYLYVDITCLDIGKLYHPDQNKLPTRQDSKDIVRELIETHQPKKIHIDADMIGSEDMVKAVAQFTSNTSEEVLSRLNAFCSKTHLYTYMLGEIPIPSTTTSCKSELHISNKAIFREECKMCDKDSTLRIRATLAWIFLQKGYSYSDHETWKNQHDWKQYWQILYSHHSSDAELREFFSHLRYEKIFPINDPFSRYLEEKGGKISKTLEEKHNYLRESLYCTLDRYNWKPRVLWFSKISGDHKSDERFEIITQDFEKCTDIVTKVEEMTQSSFFYYIVIPCSTGSNWNTESINQLISDLTRLLTRKTVVLLYSTKCNDSSKWKQELGQIQPAVRVNLHHMDVWNIPEFHESSNQHDIENRIVVETLANLRRNRDRIVQASDWPIPYEYSRRKRESDQVRLSEPQSQEIEMSEVDEGHSSGSLAQETEPQSQEIEMYDPGK